MHITDTIEELVTIVTTTTMHDITEVWVCTAVSATTELGFILTVGNTVEQSWHLQQ